MCFQPISRSAQYGEGFYYIVSYKRRDVRNAQEIKINVTNWQQSEKVISGQEMYKQYEIYVQSANSEGLAPPATVERRLGYSGQDGMSPLFLKYVVHWMAFPKCHFTVFLLVILVTVGYVSSFLNHCYLQAILFRKVLQHVTQYFGSFAVEISQT